MTPSAPSDSRESALTAIAAELAVVPPGDFVRARNEQASQCADPLLRKQVSRLRKPVVAAWAVNALVHKGSLAEALTLAEQLREAQEDLDVSSLATLGTQRRQLVAALARQAVELAESAGVSISAAAHTAIEATINAAVIHPVASALVSTGRLLAPLEAAEIDTADLETLIIGAPPEVTAPGPITSGTDAPPPRDELAERREQRARQRAAREAERDAVTSERTLAQHEKKLAAAIQQLTEREERVTETRDLLTQLEKQAHASATQCEQLRSDVARAKEESKAAAQRAKSAREAAGEPA